MHQVLSLHPTNGPPPFLFPVSKMTPNLTHPKRQTQLLPTQVLCFLENARRHFLRTNFPGEQYVKLSVPILQTPKDHPPNPRPQPSTFNPQLPQSAARSSESLNA